MSTTYSNAVDEINAVFWQNWNTAETLAIVGYVPEVRWQYVQEPETPDGSKFWARVSVQTVLESQATFSNDAAKPWQKRYTSSGLVFVQIFCPKSNQLSGEIGRKISEIARNSFRGALTPSNVWFKNARISEAAPEELFYRFNVVAEFEYDEFY